MFWDDLRDDTVTVKLKGDTFRFKPNENKEVKSEGITIRFYEETFREKKQPTPVSVMSTTVPHEQSNQPLTNRTTKQQTIEELFAMSMDDLALKLNRLQKEREKNQTIIETYAKEEKEMVDFLQQMIKKEWYLNRDIADAVLKQYAVHPEQTVYQQNLSNPKAMVEALFYCQHCHRTDIQDMMHEVRRAKQENWSLGKAIEELEGEREQEKEKMQQMLTDFKAKYLLVQEELQQKTREVAQLTHQNETFQTQLTAMTQASEKTEETIAIGALLENTSLNSELDEMDIPASAFIEAKETKGTPKADFKLQSRQQLRQYPTKKDEITDPLFDFSFLEATNDVQEEMPYVRLLKEKGYAVEPASSHQYDWMVANNTEEKIPLMYIYYDIEKADEFDNLMKDTDKMYFVFDSKKRMFKGNTKFTSWLLKQKERKFDIQFSFTTVDQLKTVGLSALDKM